MAVAAITRRPRVPTLASAPATAGVLLAVLTAGSALLRTSQLGAGYWIDEGLSVGIADHSITAIGGVLREDGSPPLYYLLLHVWMRVTGSQSEEVTHLLSLLTATLAVPVAWALVRALAGARAGWIAAVLVAGCPFLTQYAQESRMYALVVLLALTACATFLGAFAFERGRAWTVGYGAAQAALLYSHNWGLFLGAGLFAAWVALVALAPAGVRRRALVREGLIAAGVLLVLYGPWLPTLAFQVVHTGAPWANPPSFTDFYRTPARLLGTTVQYLLIVGVGAGLLVLWRGRRPREWSAEGRAAGAMALTAVVALALPWLISQISPTWAYRYLAVIVAPLLLLATLGLARARALGVAVLALVVAAWLGMSPAPSVKSNVRGVTSDVQPALAPGDLVVSTQPEQIPVLHYYWRGVGGLRWATLWGPVADLGVTDWRDGVEHLQSTSPERDLAPLLDRTLPGQRVALVEPDFSNLARWRAPWSALVRQRSLAWEAWMRNDRRFRVIDVTPSAGYVAQPNSVRVQLSVRADTLGDFPNVSPVGAATPPASPSP